MTLRNSLRLVLALAFSTAMLASAETTFLPGAAEVTGLAGARFSSTLEIANPGATGATVAIGLVPMEGATAPAPVTRTLGAGESLRVREALKALFGLADGAAGTITVTSDATLVSSLTTQNVAAPEGAYGLGLLPVPEGDLLGAGETGHSIWVSQSADPVAGYRTNLSVTLAEAGTVVEVRVFDASGHVAGAATVSGSSPLVWQRPVKALAGDADLPVARAEFEVKSGRAAAYAVVNDNVTSDAIALQAERVVPGALDRLVSGAALSPGLLGAYWVTDLRLFNPGSEEVTATIRSVGAPTEAVLTLPVPAKGVVEVARALERLGLPERTACALRVSAARPLLVAARTNNIDPSGVRKGTFSAQQFVTTWPAGLLPAGATGFFPGIDQTLNVPGVRTNLTLVGGPEGASGELILRNAAGAEQARASFTRGAGEWGQLSVADWFGAAAGARGALSAATIPENARVDVAVANGALDAYVSRIDNGSGDAVTRPFALPGGGDCSKVAITAFGAAPQPIRTSTPTTFSWTLVLDPPSAELTSQSIRFDGEPEVELDKSARSYARSFAAAGSRSATLTVRKGNCVKTRSLSFYVCGDLSVDPATLPQAIAFRPYPAVALTIPGATAPVTWAVSAGALPQDLSLSASGEITGVPAEVGTFAVTVRGTDANGCTGTRAYSLVVRCPTIRISPATLPAGTVGLPWGTVSFSAEDGSGSGTWSATGLPPGLVLSPAGVLSGTPTTAGNFDATVTYTDDSGCTGKAAYRILVCNTLVVGPASLAAATAGVAYGPVPFSVSGASGVATWAVTSGALPSGMSLDPVSGVLSGTPVVVGSFPFTVTATDTLGCKGSAAVTLVVNCPAIAVSPASLSGGTAGVAYPSTPLTQTGAVGAVAWSVTAGALPAGMSLSPAGVLSGTPTVVGNFSFTATATDANGCTGSRPYNLTIACPTITLGALVPASGTAGVAYSATLSQTGGVGAVTFAVTAGALPAGVSLLPNGTLSGTPLVTGPFNFSVTATDANGCTGTQGYALTIACPTIAVSPASIASGTAGVPYAPVTFTQTGGVGTIAWSVIGTLPNGVSVNPGTGVLSGTPLQTGSFPITVRATDVNGCVGDRAIVLTVACPTITVGPATVPTGTAGVVYPGAAFTQTGGVGTIVWSVIGTLPNGISLDPASGVLSGTPLQTGSFPITVRATDANSCIGERAVTLTIQCPTITVGASGSIGGVEGSAITPVTFTQSGGVGAVAWSSSGTLPSGLTFSVAGVLSGTPNAGSAGSYTVTFTATDANGCTGSTQVTFRICPVVTVGPNPITAFLQGVGYLETVVGSGGAAPYTFTVSAGTLPAGIALDGPTGVLSGSPTTLQAYDFTITATDANGCTGARQYTGRVCPVITLTTNLPNGVVGAAYSQAFAASGSPDLPYVFSLTGGALPDGLNLVAGVLTGTPTTAGTFTFTITATDANGCTGSRTYVVEVCVAPSIAPAPASVCALSTGNTASGPAGASTYAWAIANGTITSGGSSQTVTYTAGASGNVTLTLTVTSASSCTASTSVNVPINALPATPTITGVPAGGVCASSTGNTASGPAGATTYAWSITGGTITSATNLQTVTYTAGASGSVNLTLAVTNASGCSASSSTTTAINANPATPTITTPTASVCTASPGNTASGPAGATTYAWTVTGGTITSAANLQTVTYTAAASGSVQLTLVVTNASGCSATNSLVVPIDPLPTLLPATGASFTATFNTLFSQAFTASGGTGPFTYTISPSTPPAGLGFAGGILSGTPNATGTFTFTVTATSAVGCASSTQSYTLVVRPNLVADSYSGVGNTQLYVTGVAGTPTTPAVASATTAVANDTPSGNVTVTGVVSPCAGLGGAITIDSAGRFVYTPPVGATGTDVCTYTATSDTGGTGTPASATATITIGLSNRVWYVNGAAGAGDGRSSSPFNTLASASTAHATTDTVFVQSGASPTTTPGAITMKATTWLWGQGAALPAVGGITIQNTGATTKPSLTGTVTLGGSSVTVSSLDIATSGSTGLTDDQAGAITGITVQNNVTVSATNAAAVVLSSVTASASGITFTSLTSTNSGGKGVDLSSIGGSFASTTTTVTNPAGVGIDVQTSVAGGSINLGSTTSNASGGTGVNLATNAGNVTFGAFSVAPDANQRGLLATENSGTLTIASGTVTTTGNTAVEVTKTSGATPLAVTLTAVSANGGPNGIYLSRTSGSFTVAGTGSAGSGGTIRNQVGADGAVAGSGVYLSNVSNVSLARMQLNDFPNFAIRGIGVSGFSLTNSVVNGVNGTNAAIDEATIAFDGLTGTALVQNNSISGGVEDNFRVRNSSGTLNRITFDATTFGANNAATGNDALILEPSGTAVLNVTVQNCFFTSAAGDLFQLNLLGSSVSDLVFTGNTLSNNHPAIATGGGGVTISGGDNTTPSGVTLTYNIANNTFRDANGHAVLIVKSTDPGTFTGTFTNNTIGVAGLANSGSVAGDGIKLQTAGLGTFSATVTNNQIRQYNNFGIEMVTGGGAIAMSGSFNAKVTGNTVSNPGTGSLAMNGIHLNGGTVPGDTYAICVDIGGAGALANTINGSGANGGTDVRLRQRQSTTVRLPGYGGANNDNTAVQTYLSGRNLTAPSALASNTVGSGGNGFIGGAPCLP